MMRIGNATSDEQERVQALVDRMIADADRESLPALELALELTARVRAFFDPTLISAVREQLRAAAAADMAEAIRIAGSPNGDQH